MKDMGDQLDNDSGLYKRDNLVRNHSFQDDHHNHISNGCGRRTHGRD